MVAMLCFRLPSGKRRGRAGRDHRAPFGVRDCQAHRLRMAFVLPPGTPPGRRRARALPYRSIRFVMRLHDDVRDAGFGWICRRLLRSAPGHLASPGKPPTGFGMCERLGECLLRQGACAGCRAAPESSLRIDSAAGGATATR